MVKRAPPPWKLTGDCYSFLYKFSKDFVEHEGFVPEFLKGSFCGGFGVVMLLDYVDSNIGPYKELLFVPGKFDYGGEKYHSITKIYVSTKESVENGRANWGIPKELADFKMTKEGSKERIVVSKNKETILDAVLSKSKVPLPVNTKLLPSLQLIQESGLRKLVTKVSFSGVAHTAKLDSISANKRYFADVSAIKPFIGVNLSRLKLNFPEPVELKI